MVGLMKDGCREENTVEEKERKVVFKTKGSERRNEEQEWKKGKVGESVIPVMDATNTWGSSRGGQP